MALAVRAQGLLGGFQEMGPVNYVKLQWSIIYGQWTKIFWSVAMLLHSILLEVS